MINFSRDLKSRIKLKSLNYAATNRYPYYEFKTAIIFKGTQNNFYHLSYEKIKQNRRNAFAKTVTSKEIREYGAKNRLPENVIYKLLEKYHYLEFLKNVEDIVGDDNKISDKEADELSDYILNKKA